MQLIYLPRSAIVPIASTGYYLRYNGPKSSFVAAGQGDTGTAFLAGFATGVVGFGLLLVALRR